MVIENIKPGLLYQSSVKRMFAHAGATKRLWEGTQNGEIPRPFASYSASGGGPPALCTSPWTEESVNDFKDTMLNLTPNQIWAWDKRLKKVLLMEGLESLAFLGEGVIEKGLDTTARLINGDNPKPGWLKWLKRSKYLVRPALSLSAKAALIYRLTKLESLLNNTPLENLFRERLSSDNPNTNFDKIFSPSSVRLNVGAVDIRTGLLERFTNYLPGDVGNSEKLLAGVMGSLTLPVYFPLKKFGGKRYVDAALVSSTPIHWAVQDGCNPIWLLSYTGLEQQVTSSKCDNMFEILYRSLEIAVTEHTKTVVEGHMRVNNDLKSARERGIDTTGFSFDGKTETEFIIVKSDEKLPDIDLMHLKQEHKQALYEIGYNAVDKAIKQRLLQTAA